MGRCLRPSGPSGLLQEELPGPSGCGLLRKSRAAAPTGHVEGEGREAALALLLAAGPAGVHAASAGPRRLRASWGWGRLQTGGHFVAELDKVVLGERAVPLQCHLPARRLLLLWTHRAQPYPDLCAPAPPAHSGTEDAAGAAEAMGRPSLTALWAVEGKCCPNRAPPCASGTYCRAQAWRRVGPLRWPPPRSSWLRGEDGAAMLRQAGSSLQPGGARPGTTGHFHFSPSSAVAAGGSETPGWGRVPEPQQPAPGAAPAPRQDTSFKGAVDAPAGRTRA